MASVDVDGELFIDPDDVKVPESPRHRRIVELVGTVAGHLVSPDRICYRDMNWYPPDDGQPIAPDVMVLGAGAVGVEDKSYRQAESDQQGPSVVVEVPSDSDGWGPFWAKADRYGRLGVVLYVINIDHRPEDTVMRLGPDDTGYVPWTGQPIPELGNLVVDLVGEDLVVRTPDGRLHASSTEDLAHAAAERDAAVAERDAVAAERDRLLAEIERLQSAEG